MSFEIRRLVEEDTAIIAEIRQSLSKRWMMSEDAIQQKFILPAMEDEKLPFIFLLYFRERFAGSIMLAIEKEGYLSIKNQPWILDLNIHAEFRGHGLGLQLIERAKQAAKENGFQNLYLDTASSVGYYDKIGGWELLGTAWWEAGEKEVSIMKTAL